MRTLLKMQLPTDAANQALRDGRMEKVLMETAEALKAESAYFGLDNGLRTMWAVFDLEHPGRMPSLLEPAMQELNAAVFLSPVMTPQDLAAALAEGIIH